jgi:hypothetical protein
MDRQDAALLASTYWPDGWDDHGMIESSGEDFSRAMVPMWPAMKMDHLLGQSCIDIRDKFANVETYFFAYHRMGPGDETKDVFLGGRYNDRLEKRGSSWRFIHRVAVYDWYRDLGRSAPWDDSVFPFGGMPERSYGSAGDNADYFWELFANQPLRRGSECKARSGGSKVGGSSIAGLSGTPT